MLRFCACVLTILAVSPDLASAQAAPEYALVLESRDVRINARQLRRRLARDLGASVGTLGNAAGETTVIGIAISRESTILHVARPTGAAERMDLGPPPRRARVRWLSRAIVALCRQPTPLPPLVMQEVIDPWASDPSLPRYQSYDRLARSAQLLQEIMDPWAEVGEAPASITQTARLPMPPPPTSPATAASPQAPSPSPTPQPAAAANAGRSDQATSGTRQTNSTVERAVQLSAPVPTRRR